MPVSMVNSNSSNGANLNRNTWVGAFKRQFLNTALRGVQACKNTVLSLFAEDAPLFIREKTPDSDLNLASVNPVPDQHIFSGRSHNLMNQGMDYLSAAQSRVTQVLQKFGVHFSWFKKADTLDQQFSIATPHALATKVGADILSAGGNAYDAAVAVAAALAVVEPFGSGIGGGGAWLFHDEKLQKDVFIDGREKAPGASTADMFLKADGTVDRELTTNHPLSSGVPGTPAAMIHIQEKYGTMSLAQLLQPAIELAEKGFPVSQNYVNVLNSSYASVVPLNVLKKWPSSSIFLDNGQVPNPGWILKQTDLANTLKQIAEHGRQGFYEGPVARTMVDEMQKNGGLITLQDLKNYKVVEREPIKFTYNGNTITSAPLPSSGGLALASMFGQLEKLQSDDASPEDSVHLNIETMRNAYLYRAEYMGDPDFTHDTGDWIASDAETKKMADQIRIDQARPSLSMPLYTSGCEGTQTTHFSIIDVYGNRASITLSLNAFFGSGFTVKGLGCLMNNQMDDFSSKPGEPNSFGLVGSEANKIESNKRPLSSMTPSFVEGPNGDFVLGTPGGSRIITMVHKGILDAIKGEDVSKIVSNSRYHHQYLPDVIEHEKGAFPEKIKASLLKKGHILQETENPYGNLQAVRWDKVNKVMTAASDPRREGLAVVGTLRK